MPAKGRDDDVLRATRPAPDASKATWRAWAHAVRHAWGADPDRRARDQAAVRGHLAAWPRWRRARHPLVYVAFGDELDPLANDAADPPWATTRTVGAHAPLELRAYRPPFERHPFGFLQPRADAPRVDPAAVDLVLVPGLAFDRGGGRLGHGQGHYDRLLPTLPPDVPRVGVAIDALVVARVPTEAHDVPMTHLLTPSGLHAIEG